MKAHNIPISLKGTIYGKDIIPNKEPFIIYCRGDYLASAKVMSLVILSK